MSTHRTSIGFLGLRHGPRPSGAGYWVYAQGKAEQATHQVRHADIRLEIAALDLSGTIDELLKRIDELADQIRALRGEARHMSRAA